MGVPPSYSRSTTPFRRSKYIPAQTTFRQKSDNLKDIYFNARVKEREREGERERRGEMRVYYIRKREREGEKKREREKGRGERDITGAQRKGDVKEEYACALALQRKI